jgi:aminotransferase
VSISPEVQPNQGVRSRIASRVEELKPSGIRKFFELVMGRPDILSLGVGEPDFPTPWPIREQGIFSLEKGQTSYTSNQGDPHFRDAIARWFRREMGVSYNPKNEILVTVGVSEGLDLACRAILEEGEEVLIPEPCFVSYPALVHLAGGTPVEVPTHLETGFLPSVEDLEARRTDRTRMVLFNFPGNPTGATISREQMVPLAEWIVDNDLILLTDEIYSPITYEGKHECFAALPGMKERTLLFHGLSKAWAMTGWRIGFVGGPADICAAMTKIHQYQIMCAPISGQVAGIEALDHGERDSRKMVEEYGRRRRVIVDRLNQMGLTCHLPNGAFYVFPSIRSTGLSSEDFALRLLEEHAVAVVPGNAFGTSGEGHIRACYATSLTIIEEAMDRMKRFVESL